MKVTVKLMSIYKLAVGEDEVTLQINEGSSVKDLAKLLCDKYENLNIDLKSTIVIQNKDKSTWDAVLNDGDELYFLHQFGGG